MNHSTSSTPESPNVGMSELVSGRNRATQMADSLQIGMKAIDGRLGIIGCGQMASALVAGLASKKMLVPSNTVLYDPDPAQVSRLALQFSGMRVAANNAKVVLDSDVVFLCVKPQVVSAVLVEIAPAMSPSKLLVSIAAGVKIDAIKLLIGSEARVVRVMPNTPCLVGAGAAAVAAPAPATRADEQLVLSIFNAIGMALALPEKLLDAVTGLSGSGPAYVFMIIEALADGGVKAGLPRKVALELATQTVFGSAKMLLETGKHPGELKDAVASPAGTTIAGISELERRGVRSAFIDAVCAAADRSQELGNL